MKFSFNIKVYYEDTDSGGVVYYANYLKFIERARTNLIHELGFKLKELQYDYDSLFIVKKINCDYLRSARLEDCLTVRSSFINIKNASFELEQNITRESEEIFNSKVLMVCVNKEGKPKKIPYQLTSKIY